MLGVNTALRADGLGYTPYVCNGARSLPLDLWSGKLLVSGRKWGKGVLDTILETARNPREVELRGFCYKMEVVCINMARTHRLHKIVNRK